MAPSLCKARESGDDCPEAKLYLITYLVPNQPIELFMTYQVMFEKVLENICSGSRLIVELRHSSPPEGEVDPFSANEVDIGFLCSSGFVRHMDKGNKFMEFLPVLPLFKHPISDTISEEPYYYSQVIVHKKKIERFKCFEDLKGYTWAMNDPESFAGNIAVLAELRKNGANSNFFGNLIHSNSHIESIKAVIEETADGAAVDSNVLQLWLEEHPENRNEVAIVCTWGPWPVPPIVVNSRLPATVKKQLVEALLSVHKDLKLAKQFVKFGIHGFVEASSSVYNKTREVLQLAKNEVVCPVYY